MIKNLALFVCSVLILGGTIASPKQVHSESSNAFILDKHNDVQIKTKNNPVWQDAEIKTTLNTGDSIRTGRASKTTLKYTDGTVTRLGANSMIRLQASTEKRSNLRLLIGKLWLKVTRGDENLRIETPSAVASILGTELFISNTFANVSHITTLDGLVRVENKNGEKTLVKAGEWVEVVPGKPLEQPTKFNWDELRNTERFLLDPDFKPEPKTFQEEEMWR